MAAAPRSVLLEYHRALQRHFAPAGDLDRWWPGRTRFEIIAGAILVQNTSWNNAALALGSLRAAGKLTLAGVRGLDEAELGALIRSAGFWRHKARCLRAFVAWLDVRHRGRLANLFAQPTAAAREQLLALYGIGEETADAILLFAGGHPGFILDAYSRRIFGRHHHPATRAWIESQLPANPRLHRHIHALLVETGKHYCRKRFADCGRCPLGPWRPA